MKSEPYIWLGIALIWVLSLYILVLCQVREIKSLQKQAIQHNAAEWVVDEDGNVSFEWRELNDD